MAVALNSQALAVPDRHGGNLFEADPHLAALLRVYMPAADK